MMWLWVTYASMDWFLLRFSLSNSDAMSIAALALSLWALYLFWKNKASLEKRVDALELINTALAKSLPPEDLKLVIQSVVEHELIPRVKRMKKIKELRESGNKAVIEALEEE
jgi:hypothetical protein